MWKQASGSGLFHNVCVFLRHLNCVCYSCGNRDGVSQERHSVVLVSTGVLLLESMLSCVRVYCVYLGVCSKKKTRKGWKQWSRMVKIKVVLQRVQTLKLHHTYLLCSFSSHEYWGACWLVVCVRVCVSSGVVFDAYFFMRHDIRSRSGLQRVVVCLLCVSNMWERDKNTEAGGQTRTKASAEQN